MRALGEMLPHPSEDCPSGREEHQPSVPRVVRACDFFNCEYYSTNWCSECSCHTRCRSSSCHVSVILPAAGSTHVSRDTTTNAAIQSNPIQSNTIQYNAMQFNAIQCNTMQYNAMQAALLSNCGIEGR